MKQLPDTVTSYKRTPEFNQDTVPAGLLAAHQTKAGTWGLIVVTIWQFTRVSALAAGLLAPYLAWVSFASVLNLSLWQLNPQVL